MAKRLRISQIIIKSVAGLLIASLIMLAVTAVILFAKTSYNIGYAVFDPVAYEKNGKTVNITIPEGAGNRQVAEELYKAGLVENPVIAYLQLKLSKYSKKIEPGEYKLSSSMLPDELFEAISKNSDESKR